jgi:Questin oxidase-like
VTINAQDWISKETKARMLEWKIRMDLLQYAARGVPELGMDKLTGYKPKDEKEGEGIQGE